MFLRCAFFIVASSLPHLLANALPVILREYMQAHQVDHVQNTIMLRKFLTTLLVHMHIFNTSLAWVRSIASGRRPNRLNMMKSSADLLLLLLCSPLHPRLLFIQCLSNVVSIWVFFLRGGDGAENILPYAIYEIFTLLNKYNIILYSSASQMLEHDVM